jgi:hypothetical protein
MSRRLHFPEWHTDQPHPIFKLEPADGEVVKEKFGNLIPHTATVWVASSGSKVELARRADGGRSPKSRDRYALSGAFRIEAFQSALRLYIVALRSSFASAVYSRDGSSLLLIR